MRRLHRQRLRATKPEKKVKSSPEVLAGREKELGEMTGEKGGGEANEFE